MCNTFSRVYRVSGRSPGLAPLRIFTTYVAARRNIATLSMVYARSSRPATLRKTRVAAPVYCGHSLCRCPRHSVRLPCLRRVMQHDHQCSTYLLTNACQNHRRTLWLHKAAFTRSQDRGPVRAFASTVHRSVGRCLGTRMSMYRRDHASHASVRRGRSLPCIARVYVLPRGTGSGPITVMRSPATGRHCALAIVNIQTLSSDSATVLAGCDFAASAAARVGYDIQVPENGFIGELLNRFNRAEITSNLTRPPGWLGAAPGITPGTCSADIGVAKANAATVAANQSVSKHGRGRHRLPPFSRTISNFTVGNSATHLRTRRIRP